MRSTLAIVLGMAVALCFTLSSSADDKAKDVTLKGTICCAKCELKQAKTCTNAIKVKEDGKDVVYLFEDKGGKASYHGKICQTTKEGEVTGVVSEKDGKKYIKPKDDKAVKFND